MPLSDAALVIAATPLRAAITHVSIATANPGTGGINQASSARQPITWGTIDADGDFTSTAVVNFTLGGANSAAQYVCFWSAATGGVFYGSQALTGDQNFNAAGEYSLTAVTVNGTST